MESAVLFQRTPPPHAWRLVWVIGDIWTRHTALSFVYTNRRDELSRFRNSRPKGIIHRRELRRCGWRRQELSWTESASATGGFVERERASRYDGDCAANRSACDV
jgi:hypothetical protein